MYLFSLVIFPVHSCRCLHLELYFKSALNASQNLQNTLSLLQQAHREWWLGSGGIATQASMHVEPKPTEGSRGRMRNAARVDTP